MTQCHQCRGVGYHELAATAHEPPDTRECEVCDGTGEVMSLYDHLAEPCQCGRVYCEIDHDAQRTAWGTCDDD